MLRRGLRRPRRQSRGPRPRRGAEVDRALVGHLAFEVVDQVAEGDRVASRFVLTGAKRGRQVRLWGIVISRLRDGRIVEDWAAADSLELLKQLGLRRTLLAAPRLLGALRAARGS